MAILVIKIYLTNSSDPALALTGPCYSRPNYFVLKNVNLWRLLIYTFGSYSNKLSVKNVSINFSSIFFQRCPLTKTRTRSTASSTSTGRPSPAATTTPATRRWGTSVTTTEPSLYPFRCQFYQPLSIATLEKARPFSYTNIQIFVLVKGSSLKEQSP